MPDAPASSAREDLLATLLASSPPRPVPAPLLRAADRQGAPLFLVIFGLGFGAFGSFFGWAFFPWGFWHDLELNGTRAAHAAGLVDAVRKTSYSEGGSKHSSGTPVYAYDFTFTPASGAVTHATSFALGTRWKPGQHADIEYLAAAPTVARLAGSRTTVSSLAALFVLIFPLVGFTLAAFGLRARRGTRWLLEHGTVGEALVQSIEATANSVNHQTVYCITLARADAAGDTTFEVRKYQSAVLQLLRTRLASKQPVFVLFDPAKPKRALFPETLL